MHGTQGVILVLVGVLILYLVWSRSSPLNQPTTPAAPTGGQATPRSGDARPGGTP